MKEQPDLDKLDENVRRYIGGKRYQHTLGVLYTAASLAMAHGCSLDRAEAAGLLHDCAKKIPDEKKLRMCDKNGIEITECERRNPYLLHTKLGAWIAENEFGVRDEEVLDAIRYHTTGRPEMTMLEQIIFIADYIEPHRDKAMHLDEVRRTAFRDLDECCYMILRDTLNYLNSRSGEIDVMTEQAYDYYKEIHDKKGTEN
jgi:predicted HD superfamily hydrolase involved in NAD metabolism